MFLLLPLNLLSDDWVKTDNGCEFMTMHTDASMITWDGECLDGKVHGNGTLTLFKNDTLFYEFKGITQNGYTKKGEIFWANDAYYANYVWVDSDDQNQKNIGIFKVKNGDTYLGEITGFANPYQVIISPNFSYRCGIVNEKLQEFQKYLTVEQFENYFGMNYSPEQYQHFIPLELPNKTIAITYFDNTSKDPSYDPLIKGLADMLISDLSGIESVNMVEREKLDAILKEIDLGESKFIDNATAQKMGKGLGAQYILTGSFIVMGDDFRIDARLVNVGNGEIVFSKAVEGNKETFFDIQDDLANEIIEKLQLNTSNRILSDMKKYGTKSFEAWDEWRTGQNLFDIGNYDSSIVHFNNSLKFDSTFPLSLVNCYVAHHLMINQKYQGYLEKFDNHEWISSSIKDIDMFLDLYDFLTSYNLPSKAPLGGLEIEFDNDYWKKMRSGICTLIMNYFCNSTMFVDGKNRCDMENMSNAYIWAKKAYSNYQSPSSLGYYGWFKFRYKDDPKGALEIYNEAILLDSLSKNTYLRILELLSHYNNYEGIVEYGEKYLKIDPNSANQAVYIWLGTAYQSLKSYEKALEYYNTYKNLGYGTSSIHQRIGMCYYDMGNYKTAAEHFSVVDKSLNPKDLLVNYEYLTYCYYHLKSYEKTYNANKKYIQFGIENDIITKESLMRAYSNQADIAKHLNDYESMYSNLKSAKEINERYWLVRNNLCEYYMITKDYEKALEEIEYAIRLAPELPETHDTMGDLQVKMGNYDEAIDNYLRAIEKDSTFSDGYLHLALVYEKQSEKDHIEYYIKAAELGNEDANIWVKKNKKLIDDNNNKSKVSNRSDYIEELKKLAELKSLGIITEEEFDAKKKELLGL